MSKKVVITQPEPLVPTKFVAQDDIRTVSVKVIDQSSAAASRRSWSCTLCGAYAPQLATLTHNSVGGHNVCINCIRGFRDMDIVKVFGEQPVPAVT